MPPQLAVLQVAGQLQSACQQRNGELVDTCLQNLSRELQSQAQSKAESPNTSQLGMKEILKLLFIMRDTRTILSRSTASDQCFRYIESGLSSATGFEKVEAQESQLLQLCIAAATCSAQSVSDILSRLRENPYSRAPKKLLHIDLTCSTIMFVVQQLQEHPNSKSLGEAAKLMLAVTEHLQDPSRDQQGVRTEVEVVLKVLYGTLSAGMATSAPLASQPVVDALLFVATKDQILLSAGAKYIVAILRKLGLYWKSDCSAVTADTLSSFSRLFENMGSLTFSSEHVELFDTAMAIFSLLSTRLSASFAELIAKLASQAWSLTCFIPALERYRGKAAVAFSTLVIGSPTLHETKFPIHGKQAAEQWMQDMDLPSYNLLTFHFVQSLQNRMARLSSDDDKVECLNYFIRCILPALMDYPENSAQTHSMISADSSASQRSVPSKPSPRTMDACGMEEITFSLLGHRHALTPPSTIDPKDLLALTEQRIQNLRSSKTLLNPHDLFTAAMSTSALLLLDPLNASAVDLFTEVVQLLQVSSTMQVSMMRATILAIHLVSFEWLHIGLVLRLRNVEGSPLLHYLRRVLPPMEDADFLRAECAVVRWAICLDSLDKCVSNPSSTDCPVLGFIQCCSNWLHETSTVADEVTSEEVQGLFEAAVSALSASGQHLLDAKQMQAILHLFHGRVQFLRCQKIAIASRSAKYALHYLQSDLVAPLRVDALLLLMELHDFVGRLGRALDYMAEVESICQSHKTLGPMLRAVSSLHTIRILYRCQSRQLPEVLKSAVSSSSLLSVYHADLYKASAWISDFIEGNDRKTLPATSDRRTGRLSTKKILASLPRTRSLHLLWGLFENRHGVCSYNGLSSMASWNERLSSQQRLSFDHLRMARRGLAAEALEQENTDLAFILAAASICTSNEMQTISQAEEVEGRTEASSALPISRLLSHCLQVQSACLGVEEDLLDLQSQLRRLPKRFVFCFVCLDDEHQTILLGRCEQAGLSTFRTGAREWEEVRATLGEFAKSMQAVDDSLRQTRSIENAKGMTASQKKNWWAGRENVDQQLSRLTERMEAVLEPHLRKLLAGAVPTVASPTIQLTTEEDCNEIDRLIAQMGCTELGSEESFEVDSPSPSRESYEAMKIVELRDLAKQRGLQTIGRKAELIDRLVDHDALQSQSTPALRKGKSRTSSSSTIPSIETEAQRLSPEESSSDSEAAFEHIVLMLDESLQSFPMEALPMLRNSSVSRVPSLPLLLSLLSTKEASCQSSSDASPKDGSDETSLASLPVDRCWYAVDVENNLPETRKTIQAFLEPLSARHGWKGTIGAYPSEPAVRDWNSWAKWYIYCGHGAGEKVLSSLDDEWNHRAALLWGCSSVRLLGQGCYDPHGAVLSHLQAGCQLVAGNLWDVTDRDLDKLSISCMQAAMRHVEKEGSQEAVTLTCALRTGREACKMRYAVASAAVAYGLPLSLSKE